MIRKIVLENYMAHTRTVIEPANGLTVLTGPNNCGKSAIIHALEMICYNSDAADYAIRHGAKKATVTIETQDDDGTSHTIVWWRKEKTAGYVIDGREISGLGRGKIPDDLHRYLRMPVIESGAGGKEFLLHFGLQKAPIFLLDDPPSSAAQFFASATDADKLVQMQKLHQQKVISAKRDRERLDGELGQLDRQLEALLPLPALSEGVSILEEDHRKLSDLAVKIAAMRINVSALERLERDAVAIAMQIQVLAQLEKTPSLHDTQPLNVWIHAAECCQSDVTQNGAFTQALRQLDKPPELAQTHALNQSCKNIDITAGRIAREQSLANALTQLAMPPEQQNVLVLRKALQDIHQGEAHFAKLNALTKALVTLADPPKMIDAVPLLKALDALCASDSFVNRLQFRYGVLKDLTPAPLLHDTEPLRIQIDAIANTSKEQARISERATKLSRLTHPEEPVAVQEIANFIKMLEIAVSNESRAANELRQTNAACEKFQEEIAKWIRNNPRCIACGQALSTELITSGGHSHE